MRLFFRCFLAWQLPGGRLFALLCAAALNVATANAATLTVTTTADSGAGSLRDAIAAASNGDTIQFDAALNGQTINLTSGELAIDKNITIIGPGASLLAVSRDSNSMAKFRIFHVTPGHTSTIEGLTISGNHANPPAGGVFNEATLTINNCILDHNFSEGDGGGILNSGTLTIRNSSVSGSTAGGPPPSVGGSGGGIFNSGTLDISKSAIFGNEANFWGGGISNSGTVTITDCIVRNNLTGSEFILGSGFGGGISNQDNGTLTIRNSTVSGNISNGNSSGGGGIFSGSGNTTLVITNSTISGNLAHPKGGGILNGGSLTITNSTVSDNSILSPGNGGSIHNGGMVQIGNTILKTNAPGVNIFNDAGAITSHGYNLSSDNGGGFLTATGDQINTDPMLGPLQDNGGPTFTHDLLTGSPAIDAGDPNFTPPPLSDQRGYARVFNGRIDIGSLEVQPSPTPTPTPTPIALSGTSYYCSNPLLDPVPGVTMTLTGTSSAVTTTDINGNYTFAGLASGSYTMTPTKPALAPGTSGINTSDSIAVQRHFLIVGPPLSGCRLTAADVNGDNRIDTSDVVAIQRFFLGLSIGIANVGKYQFTPANRTYPGLVTNQTGQNFDALVLGDVASGFVERPAGGTGDK